MDAELINQIVKEVRDSLKREGMEGTAPGISAPGEDQFLKKIFVTAADLQRKIDQGSSSSVELAANEYLTPAAQDLAARRRIGITRKTDTLLKPVNRPVADQKALPTFKDVPLSATRVSGGCGPVGLVTYLPDEKTGSVLKALAHDGIFFTDYTDDDCWMINLVSLCRGITEGTLDLGVALFPFGADAVIMANKIPGIRAVQGTRIESVSASIRRLNSNLLVLEHRLSTFHELRAMTRIFIQSRMVAGLADDVIGKIEELEKQ